MSKNNKGSIKEIDNSIINTYFASALKINF